MSYELKRVRAYFTRYAVKVHIFCNGVAIEDTPWSCGKCLFAGNDGRKVRAEAIRWAKARCAR